MKNRAKCKLCKSIIESTHVHDYVSCSCGEISIDGGINYYRVSAKDFSNFLRVDDEGNEIIVTFKEPDPKSDDVKPLDIRPTYSDLLDMLDAMSKNIERLPLHAMTSPVTQYDLSALISLLHMLLIDLDSNAKKSLLCLPTRTESTE